MKNNIVFFVGTTAELIKVFPIMQELEKRSVGFKIVASGQNELDGDIISTCKLNEVDCYLSRGEIKQTTLGLLLWFTKTLVKGFFKLRKTIRTEHNEKNIFVVHGDTISTVMGAILGKLLGFKVCHVESGLRSFNILKPFPEELDRILVSNISDIHCCPNDWSVGNVKNKRGLIVNTKQNTLLDSLNFALNVDFESQLTNKLRDEKYFIFVLHRQENLYDDELVMKISDKVFGHAGDNMKCFIVLHSPTKMAFRKLGLLERIDANPNIITSDRLGYFEFMKIMSNSQFIVTDGGSNQEESYYFGKPCLILRKETERNEGFDHNVLLSQLDFTIIDNFFDNIEHYRKSMIVTDVKPSTFIADAII